MPSNIDPTLTQESQQPAWQIKLQTLPLPHPVLRAISLFSSRSALDGYLAAADQGTISAANFLATLILARFVTPTELGVYGVGFTALHLVRSIQEGITVQPMNAYGPAMDREEFKRYATSTSIIQILLAVLSALSVAVGGWLLAALGNDTAGPALFYLWFAFLFWQMQEYLRRMLYSRGNVVGALLNTLLSNGVRLAILGAWAVQGRLSGVAGLNAIAWGSLGALLPGLWQTRSYWTKDFLSLKETWTRNWGFGRWILGGTLANWVSVEFYPILTAGMISFAAAGAYRALQNLVAPIHLILRALDTFLTPRASRHYQENGRSSLTGVLTRMYLAAGIPVLGLLGIALLFPKQLLHLLYGETYLPYSRGMVIMAAFYALWFSYWPLQTALKAARFSKPIFAANLTAIFAMFTIGIWMIDRWGVNGTIGGQALNALIVSLILWTAWLRRKKTLTIQGEQ